MKIRINLRNFSTREKSGVAELATSRFPELEVVLKIELERYYLGNNAYMGDQVSYSSSSDPMQ